jgi:hypothetical protein
MAHHTGRCVRVLTATAAILVAAGALEPAAAQAADPLRPYVDLRGGASIEEAEDNLSGVAAAGGLAGGIPLTADWTLEIDLWAPEFIGGDGGTRHRDILLNGGLVRTMGSGRVRPHLLFGLGVAFTRDELESCVALRSDGGAPPAPALVSCTEPDVTERRVDRFSSESLLPFVGAGAAIAVTNGLSIVPDVRLSVGVGVVIVRPSLGVRVAF